MIDRRLRANVWKVTWDFETFDAPRPTPSTHGDTRRGNQNYVHWYVTASSWCLAYFIQLWKWTEHAVSILAGRRCSGSLINQAFPRWAHMYYHNHRYKQIIFTIRISQNNHTYNYVFNCAALLFSRSGLPGLPVLKSFDDYCFVCWSFMLLLLFWLNGCWRCWLFCWFEGFCVWAKCPLVQWIYYLLFGYQVLISVSLVGWIVSGYFIWLVGWLIG